MKKKLAPQDLNEFLNDEENPGPWKKLVREETKQIRQMRALKKIPNQKERKWK